MPKKIVCAVSLCMFVIIMLLVLKSEQGNQVQPVESLKPVVMRIVR
jgi:uncharacterized secreted protein with C-terminal beta-propeller domain